MRLLRSLAVYAVAVFLIAALLAPVLYQLAQGWTSAHPFVQQLAAKPFHRYVEISLLVLALAGLWPLCRSLGVNSWSGVGLVNPLRQWRRWLGSFLMGLLSLAIVAVTALACGGRIWKVASHTSMPSKMLHAVATAIVVAVLEEILFRGGIFGGLRRALDWRVALMLSSVIYTITHFFRVGQLNGPVTWVSGLSVLGEMLTGLPSAPNVVPAFFNLTLAGLLLGLAYQRTDNLYFSICLHAGWIFWLKSYGMLTGEVPGAANWFWGGRKMIDGWLAFIVLSVALILFHRWICSSKREPPG